MDLLYSLFGAGAEAHQLTIGQVVMRAILMFFVALAIVRVADKRFFAKKTAFDVILGFILASMLARAINGSEQLGPTTAAGFSLALLHRVLGWAACKYPRVGGWIKGHSQPLIDSGLVDRERLKRHRIAEDDLLEELRLHGIQDAAEAKL